MSWFKRERKKWDELQKLRIELDKAREQIMRYDTERHELDRTLLIRKEELETMQMLKRMEERETKQLVKMALEQNAIELERKKQELISEQKEKEMQMQKEYHGQVIALLNKGQEQLMSVYEKIMERLPNVNMEINRDTMAVRELK